MTHLLIFALNAPNTVIHTHFTRAKGEAPTLPPLAVWLGVDALDTDAIELFLVADLADVPLADYIGLAFDPEDDIASDTRMRLNALDGSVLLVPTSAVSGDITPTAQLTQIASLPLAQPDHAATLPRADVSAPPAVAPPKPRHEAPPPVALYALIGMAIFAALVLFIGWR